MSTESPDPESALDHDRVLAAAFRVAFPHGGHRTLEKINAEQVFQRYFQEWRWTTASNVALIEERDKYMFQVEALTAEVAALKTQIDRLTKQSD